MPEEGISYEPKNQLLSFEEIIRILDVLGKIGFKKVRFTGGEPFLRKDFIKLLEKTKALNFYSDIRITTNGTLLTQHLSKLKELGINTLNLSLDTLDPVRFKKITRRDDFEQVMNAFHSIIEKGFKLKINAVVMNGINTDDILSMVSLAERYNVNVRFIEEMPFNGGYKENKTIFDAKNIHEVIQTKHEALSVIKGKHGDTATNYSIEGFKGSIGIIPAFSRTFCNTCNRLRITPTGDIKTCLYDGGIFSIRDFIRSGVTDEQLSKKFIELIKIKPKNGFVAEEGRKLNLIREESMSTIGG
jgi:cyclic pyranopterin phosphate synthase